MRAFLLMLIAALATGCASRHGQTPSPAAMNVMTYNLRFASDRPPHAWPQRQPVMAACIREAAPDIIGTQEGVYHQLKDLAADLPEYAWIGLGREGGSRGEFMAIFYRPDRFEPLEYDHYWLSDTPDRIGSITWGHTVRRMVTWVRFRDKRTRQAFYFINTHLDHQVQPAREKGAALIAQRSQSLDPSLPILLAGDFNAVAGKNRAYDILTQDGGFVDTWNIAAKRINETVSTFHGYKGIITEGERIDWILARGPVAVSSIEIVTCQRGGEWPSDHFPVMAKLTLGTASPTTRPAQTRAAR